MIIVQLCGGLGNQMFQHAAALALATYHQTEVKWDLGWFARTRLHQGFELARVFGLKHSEATASDYRWVLGWRGSAALRPHWARRQLQWLRPQSYVCEPHFHYWPGIKNTSPPFYLRGYWQSHKYFSECASTIRSGFQFMHPLFGNNLELAHEIETTNSVSLHVRRGDYAKNPITNTIHGTCPISYYTAAIEYIKRYISKPYFFLFTDDIAWTRAHLNIEYPHTFVVHNTGTESYNDMRLMSMCKHHIIANSTFSWWGAWLNDSSDKIVIAPKRWFANYPADTRDLYCPDWILL